jgi:hypothetical protein
MRSFAAAIRRHFILVIVVGCCALTGWASAQLTSTSSNGAVTITGYTGTPPLIIIIPSQINSQPVTSIGDKAFYFNSNALAVIIPSGVTNIGTSAFQGSGITSMAMPDTVTTIGDSAFASCTNLTSVTISSGATTIGASAFDFCPNLTSISIPASVTSIGSDAFSFCSNLTAINVDSNNPDYSSDGVALFDKNQTTLIQYPAGATGGYSIPGTVSTIGADAFEGDQVTSVYIPPSVTSITQGAFNACANLTAIDVDSNNPAYSSINGVVFDESQTVLEIFPCGDGGLYFVPANVTTIGTGAFNFCFNLFNVFLSSNVTTIGSDAFQGCANLTSFLITDNVTNIQDGAFYNCPNLTVFGVSSNNTAYSSVGGVLYNANQTELVEVPGKFSGSYAVPSGVTSIGDYAFADTNITSVTFPSSLTSIGTSSFYFCTNLTSLTIPASVTNISGNAFADCLNLKTVDFLGNAPTADSTAFNQDTTATAYYLSIMSGWSSPFGGITALALTPPSFTTQPKTQAVKAGSPASFSVAATGAPAPTFQWQVSTDGGNTWNNVAGSVYSGATTARLSVTSPTESMAGYQYRAVATNTSGPPSTSTPVPLVVGFSTGFTTWVKNNFSSTQLGQPTVIADTATPAGDGIPNLMKYALGLPPLVNDRNLLPQATISKGNLSLSFSASLIDVTYGVQASTDLTTWTTTGVTTTVAGTTATATYPIPQSGPAFLQVMVTEK